MSWRRGLCLLAAALMISPAAVFVLPVQGDLSDPGSLSGCANITINGDAQFTSANGVVSGDGSPGNPYILENHSISVPWSRNGISITGTSKYFIIRNCFIYGTDTTLSWGAGINLASANNGSVHHNRIISNYAGVQLQGASNIDIHDNNITLNDYGIMLSGQGVNNVVHDNDVHNNTKIGIYPTGTSNQIIKQNNVHHNLLGIGISNSPNIRLFNNTMWANNYSFAPYENASEDYPANNSMDGKPLRWVKDMVDWTFNLTAS
jgi:parallel beta-helix repeat protein